jgi:hypothetical protein
MAKDVLSFRMSEDIKTQLKLLETMELSKAYSENRRPLSRTEIIEQAIRNYYVYQTDGVKNHPQTQAMRAIIDEIFQKYMSQLSDDIGKEWYDIRLLLLYVQVISRTLNFQEQPPEFALKFINGRYDFEDEIEMKVNRELKDSRVVSLIKSIQDIQKDMKKKEENNQND